MPSSSSASAAINRELDKEFAALNKRQGIKDVKRNNNKKRSKGKKVVGANFRLAECGAGDARNKDLAAKRQRLEDGLRLLSAPAAATSASTAAVLVARNDRIKRSQKSREALIAAAKQSRKEEKAASVFTEEDFAAWAGAPFIRSKVKKAKDDDEQ